MQQGVIWALQKLSLSSHPPTQRACAVTLYRLACDPNAQAVLVREGGLRSVIEVLFQSHAYEDEESDSALNNGPKAPLLVPKAIIAGDNGAA